MSTRSFFGGFFLVLVGFAGSASAQLGGTIWLDYSGGATPLGNVAAPDLSIFPGMTNAADLANVQADLLARVQSDYSGYSVNITSMQPASGPYITVLIGNKAGDASTLFGQANDIDWRNKVFADPAAESSVGVSLNAHANYSTGANKGKFFNIGTSTYSNYTDAQLANVLANTVSHEVAHTLGLVHSDVVSTYSETAGTAAQKQSAVQSKELMTKSPASANFYAQGTLGFGTYSAIKLDVATHGVNLENETGLSAFSTPGTADPFGRNGDTGKTLPTATPLVPDAKGHVSVLGDISSSPGNFDLYSFSANAGQKIFGEVLSQRLTADAAQGDIPGADSLINNPIVPRLQLLNSLGNVIQSNDFPDTNSNLDGSGSDNVEGDALIYNYPITASGTYYWKVSDLQASPGGQYELFTVPEPSSLAVVVAVALVLLVSRQRRQTTSDHGVGCWT